MFIQKKDLISVISNYIAESLQQQQVAELAKILSSIDNKKNFTDGKDMLFNMLYKADLIEAEGMEIFNLIINYYFKSSTGNISGDEKAKNRLVAQKILINFLCNIYKVDDARKSQIIKFWSLLGQHITNPATPFAAFTAVIGQPGFAVFLFLVMEVAWLADKDLYYKLVEFDRGLMNILTLSALERSIDNFNKNATENAEEFLLNTLTLYIKPGGLEKLNLPVKSIDLIIDGQQYDMSGSQNSKNLAKERIKTLIFGSLYDSIKNAAKDTFIDLASQDPEVLRQKEKTSIEQSGGKTAFKFNVLDNL